MLENHIGASLRRVLYLDPCHCFSSFFWGVIPGQWMVEVKVNAKLKNENLLYCLRPKLMARRVWRRKGRMRSKQHLQCPRSITALSAPTGLDGVSRMELWSAEILLNWQLMTIFWTTAAISYYIAEKSHHPILLSTCHSISLGRSMSLNIGW